MDETIRVIVLRIGFRSENETMMNLDLRFMGTPPHFPAGVGAGLVIVTSCLPPWMARLFQSWVFPLNFDPEIQRKIVDLHPLEVYPFT